MIGKIIICILLIVIAIQNHYRNKQIYYINQQILFYGNKLTKTEDHDEEETPKSNKAFEIYDELN